MPFTPLIAPEIFARHPDFHLWSLVARDAGLTRPDAPELGAALAAAEAAALGDDAARDAHLAAWAEAYRAFGAKANRTPCSAAALLKRVRKDGGLPRISPLVDAYNAVSVLWGVPVGGEDLDQYEGAPRLVLAAGTEAFETVREGEAAIEEPEPGEVVWRDDAGVTCRRWNWRQSRRTMVTGGTRALWLVLEALGPMPPERLAGAGRHLEALVRALCPEARIEAAVVDRSGSRRP